MYSWILAGLVSLLIAKVDADIPLLVPIKRQRLAKKFKCWDEKVFIKKVQVYELQSCFINDVSYYVELVLDQQPVNLQLQGSQPFIFQSTDWIHQIIMSQQSNGSDSDIRYVRQEGQGKYLEVLGRKCTSNLYKQYQLQNRLFREEVNRLVDSKRDKLDISFITADKVAIKKGAIDHDLQQIQNQYISQFRRGLQQQQQDGLYKDRKYVEQINDEENYFQGIFGLALYSNKYTRQQNNYQNMVITVQLDNKDLGRNILLIEKGSLIKHDEEGLIKLLGSYSSLNGHLQLMMDGFEVRDKVGTKVADKQHNMNYQIVFSFNMRGLQFSGLMVNHFVDWMKQQLEVDCKMKSKYMLCKGVMDVDEFKDVDIVYRMQQGQQMVVKVGSVLDECYDQYQYVRSLWQNIDILDDGGGITTNYKQQQQQQQQVDGDRRYECILDIVRQQHWKGQIMVGISSLQNQRVLFDHDNHMVGIGRSFPPIQFINNTINDNGINQVLDNEPVQNNGNVYEHYQNIDYPKQYDQKVLDNQSSQYHTLFRLAILLIILLVGLFLIIRNRVFIIDGLKGWTSTIVGSIDQKQQVGEMELQDDGTNITDNMGIENIVDRKQVQIDLDIYRSSQ